VIIIALNYLVSAVHFCYCKYQRWHSNARKNLQQGCKCLCCKGQAQSCHPILHCKSSLWLTATRAVLLDSHSSIVSKCRVVSLVLWSWPDAPSHLKQISSIIYILMGLLPYLKSCFELREDDSSRDVTIFFIRRGMSGKKIIHYLVTGFVIKHFTSKSTSVYFSNIISCYKASWNICVDSVSRHNTQLQPAASLGAIPTSKPTIVGKLSRTQKSSHQNLLYRVMSIRSVSPLALRVPINFYRYTCNNIY
jgi:hypothetical protein